MQTIQRYIADTKVSMNTIISLEREILEKINRQNECTQYQQENIIEASKDVMEIIDRLPLASVEQCQLFEELLAEDRFKARTVSCKQFYLLKIKFVLCNW